MKRVIDVDSILAPIPGENPAGEDLRYSPTYDEIKAARKEEDSADLGDWQREVKTADWDKVITLSVETLVHKTKDLQIAVWLLEALTVVEGFDGISVGLKILTGLHDNYWENLYPLIEEDDFDFRAAPLEFMNDKLSSRIMQISLTDGKAALEYSLLKWKESRQVGYEKDTHNQYGDVDEAKKNRRDELLAEGKLTAEDFDSALAHSPTAFYKARVASLAACREDFNKLDENVDQKFGSQAPSLANFGQAIEECERFVTKIYRERVPIPTEESDAGGENTTPSDEEGGEDLMELSEPMAGTSVFPASTRQLSDTASLERALWKEALQLMKTSGVKKALDCLLNACYSAPSVREKNRFRLLIAKLCLQADRPDLAKPVMEELHALIEELHLERWESPLWIAEVLDTLYQCLTRGEPTDDDIGRAKALLQRLCTMDVTRAITYKS